MTPKFRNAALTLSYLIKKNISSLLKLQIRYDLMFELDLNPSELHQLEIKLNTWREGSKKDSKKSLRLMADVETLRPLP